ncbi:MAG: chromosome partitioning protein ParB [Betaproteobacteria bacterium]|nr:chromosome partitioning protein ParB [Betaproteobacteria bacterium]
MRIEQHTLITAALSDLAPTQCCVGFIEVQDKRAQWERLSHRARKTMLAQHCFPTILGPDDRPFIIDHHHLALALHEVGHKTVQLMVLKRLTWLDPETFWRLMEFHQWAHPFDQRGRRVAFAKIPTSVAHLMDDPYRSLAGSARKAAAFAKDITPFSEFLWADFFRSKIPKSSLAKDWDRAVRIATQLAGHPDASYLPGWVGAF